MQGSDQVGTQAASDPNARALIFEDRVVSWGELNTRVDTTARRLVTLGVSPGEIVAAAVEPSVEAAELLFALDRLGATFMPLPTDVAEVHREVLIERVGPDRVVTTYDLAQAEPSASLPRPRRSEDDPAWLVFTSGSEGTPAGILLSVGNISANARGSSHALRLLPGDRWLACMPMNHVAGLSIFRRAAEIGFAVVPVAEFDPLLVIRTIEQAGATAVSLVPTMLARMLEADRRFPGSVRLVLLGGGPVSEPLMNAALDRRIPVAATYGLTEGASIVTVLPPWESRGRIGTAGRPIPGVDVRIGDNPLAPAPAGTPGRIWISGPAVAKASIDGPLPSESGWLATGDLGGMDSHRYLTVLGRMDDLIVTGGEKVMPKEIEEALERHPAVKESAVIGVPDDEWGQSVVAFVVVDPGTRALGSEELRAFLKGSLVRHKIPRRVVPVDSLPRSPLGKVDRSALRRESR